MKRIISLLVGVLIVSLSLNYFILPNNLVTFGIDGIACLISYLNSSNVYLNMFILNLIVILFSLLFLDFNKIKPYIYTSILIPLVSYLTHYLVLIYPIELPEMMLNILVSSFLLGIGYSVLYKQGFKVGVVFLIEDIISSLTKVHSKSYSLFIDVITVIVLAITFDLSFGLYSFIMILIIRYMITKEKTGTNDYKMFYIITKKEKEVRDYIINDLKYELTTLDVVGGYSKKSNQILLSVISSSDYYKLKEGIKLIDKHAFIAIVDTYDVLNKKNI